MRKTLREPTLVLLIAFAFVFVNLIVDLLYAWIDPRISYR